MNKRKYFFLGRRIVLVIIIAAIMLPIILDYFGQAVQEETIIGYNATTAYARVEKIIEEGQITLGEVTQPYQIMLVEILDGNQQGQIFQIDYGTRQVRNEKIHINVGDQILVTISQNPVNNEYSAYFTDFVRSPALLWLLLYFALSVWSSAVGKVSGRLLAYC